MPIDSAPLTRADVAWLVGMSDSWVRDRMQAGELPRPGETAEQYVEAYVELRLRKFATTGGDGEGLSFEVERARLTKEQADRVAAANARDRLETASLPDMTMAVTGLIEMSKARLMRVAAIVAKSDLALRARIEGAITDALEELSITRVQEQTGGGGMDEEDSPDDE